MIHNLTSPWSHFLPDTHTTVFGCYGWFSLIDFCHSPSTSGGHRSIHLLYVFLVSLLSLHPCLTVLPTALAICPWWTCASKTLHSVKFNRPSWTAFTQSTQGFKKEALSISIRKTMFCIRFGFFCSSLERPLTPPPTSRSYLWLLPSSSTGHLANCWENSLTAVDHSRFPTPQSVCRRDSTLTFY